MVDLDIVVMLVYMVYSLDEGTMNFIWTTENLSTKVES